MSAFEKLPREIRDIIHEFCLIHDEGIISEDEREKIKERCREPAKRFGCGTSNYLIGGFPYPSGSFAYAADWPCVALLGVNNAIREEAASVLFGQNVWRLSAEHLGGRKTSLWSSYVHHFRHISTHMSMNDTGNRAVSTKSFWCKRAVDGRRPRDVRERIQDRLLFELGLTSRWKAQLLVRMSLKTLVFDVDKLYCTTGCCRRAVLEKFCRSMYREGPWYRKELDPTARFRYPLATLEVGKMPDIEEKLKTDVKIIGLDKRRYNENETEIFVKGWGLDAACCYET